MATTDDEDTNVGEGSGDAKQDYLQIASVLQSRLSGVPAGTGDGTSTLTEVLEIAAQEFGIERGDQIECMAMKGLLELRVERRCTHSCSGHKEPMNSKLWEKLPPEVLTLVFAHLPLVAIRFLKLLSKEWRQIISSADFHRVCSEVYPKMVCLITGDRYNMFWVRVLDHLRQKWHTYQIRVPSPIDWIDFYISLAACEDQGLVCFVTQWNSGSRRKKEPPTFNFTVVNPLTGSYKEPRPLSHCIRMKLVRIHVDETTKAFKVFAFATRVVWTTVGKWTDAGVAKHEYNSRSEEWITTGGFDGVPDSARRLAYDFENGQLFDQDHRSVRIPRTITSALSKRRLFVLRLGSDGPANDETANQSPMYYIEEFHWQTVWVKVDSHKCDPFEQPPKLIVLRMFLHACDGYLMVIMDGDSRDNERFRIHLAWLYDLSTRKWSTLDQIPLLPVIGPRTYDPNDHMIQLVERPGGWTFNQNCDNTYNISMIFEPKWVT